MRSAQRAPRAGGRAGGPSNVPAWSRVTAGTGVSIVLKADQPTGRQVQGVVQDVLTRHDHPRGVKVRLTDGRVGRVQRLVDVAAIDAAPSTAGLQTITSGPAADQKMRYRDMRLEPELEAPPATNDLSAYIKPAKQKKRRGAPSAATQEAPAVQQEESVCPVCGEFRGDEAAVAYHVEEHFK